MGIITPGSATEEIGKIQQETKAALPKSNPWLPSSIIKSHVTGLGGRTFDYYYVLRQAIKQCFPFEAKGKYAQFWAYLKNMIPYTSQKSSGGATWTGVLGSEVGIGTTWKIGTEEYTVDATETIETKVLNVVSLTADGLTAVCVTEEDNLLHSGMSVTISGAGQSEWNETWDDVAVTESKRFQFTNLCSNPRRRGKNIEKFFHGRKPIKK